MDIDHAIKVQQILHLMQTSHTERKEIFIDEFKNSVVIPVYNEGALIVSTIKNITSSLNNNFEILICYDFDEDDTLFEIKTKFSNHFIKSKIRFIKNCGYGPHGAVMSGINKSIGNFVIVIPADDSINSKKLINLVEVAEKGFPILYARLVILRAGLWRAHHFLNF